MRCGTSSPAATRARTRRESGTASEIATWVKQHFTPIDVAGTTVYDLDAPISK